MLTILAVDDNIDNLFMLETLAQRLGANVVGETLSDNVMPQLESLQPDMIFLDMALTGSFDGIDIIHQIRTHETLNHIFIVAFTAANVRYSEPDTYAAGCDLYFAKPFSFIDAMRRISSLLEQHRT